MLVESYIRNGVTVEIHTDEDAESPDMWGNDDVFLVAFHRQFTVTRKGWDRDIDTDNPPDGYDVVPLKAYIHGSVHLGVGMRNSMDCQWDTSNVGYIVIRKAAWEGPYDIDAIAQSLVDEWNMYLSGDVYGYVLKTRHGVVGSCFGIYGDRKYARDDANTEADAYMEPAQRLLL